MEKTNAVVQLENVTFTWHKNAAPIIDIAHFNITAKEKIFLQGPSGCGKTTLLGLIGGILKAQSGKISVVGSDINILSDNKRDTFRVEHIGYIFQMFNLLPYLSVIENVILPCHFSNKRREKALRNAKNLHDEAIRLLSELGIGSAGFLSKRVNQLSVGQQQRVAVARALIGNPEIIIADEPTSSLDMENRESFLKLLFRECELFETTLIFVSHDTSLSPLFDRYIKMSDINKTGDVPHVNTRRV